MEESPDLIRAVADEILPAVQAWPQRPLVPEHVTGGFDALRVKLRGEGLVRKK